MARKLRSSGNLYIEKTIEKFIQCIEEAEQADLGKTETGQQISFYIVRDFKKLAKMLAIDLEAKVFNNTNEDI